MSISRRKFFKIGVSSLFASFALGSRSFASTVNNLDFKSDELVSDDRLLALRAPDFRNQVGSRFNLSVNGATMLATLVEVENLDSGIAKLKADDSSYGASDYKCFALKFQLSSIAPAAAKQATYTVNHDILGKFPLFLVPGGLAAKKRLLIAIINRSE